MTEQEQNENYRELLENLCEHLLKVTKMNQNCKNLTYNQEKFITKLWLDVSNCMDDIEEELTEY